MNCVVRSVLLCLAVLFAACASAGPGGRVLGGGTRHYYRLSGQMYLDDKSGAVFFRLDSDTCKEERDVMLDDGTVVQRMVPCSGGSEDRWSKARLVTPWGKELAADAGGDRWFAFRMDWAATGIDPLAAADAAKLAGVWTLSWEDADKPFEWQPTPHERIVMLARIGAATDTQVEVQEGTAPPTLEVPVFDTVDELRNGAASGLRLRVVNKGNGPAYRLIATTRSSVPALHGLQFSFGRIDPGQQKTRTVGLKLPRDNQDKDAVVVLTFREAHDFAPTPITKRFPIKPAADMSTLTMECKLRDGTEERPSVDAGQTVHLRCEVKNDGAPASSVAVSAGITGGEKRTSQEPFPLRSGRSNVVVLPLEVPRNAQMDSVLVIDAVARDAPSGASTTAELRVVVKTAKICPRGKLTRPEFEKKRADLRKTLEAGLISEEEYLRYEGDLVSCME